MNLVLLAFKDNLFALSHSDGIKFNIYGGTHIIEAVLI